MIEISPEQAGMLYVGVLLSLLLGIWVRHSHKTRRRDVLKFSITPVTCEFCSHTYLVESVTPYHRCPQCQCMNSRQ